MTHIRRSLKLLILTALCCIGFDAAACADTIKVNLNNTPLTFDASPVIENDRVLVPLRGILEPLGYTVRWQEETQTVFADKGETKIELPLNSTSVLVNGETVFIDAPAGIKQDRTFVPLRFLAEYSGADVSWEQSTQTVFISTDGTAPKPVKPAVPQPSVEDRMKNSVVYIQTNKMQGSGIVLSHDGLIATNYHVIENASTAQFLFQDGSVYQGDCTVLGLDPQSDIAVLKINKSGLSPAPVSKTPKVGDSVRAVGSPGGRKNVITNGTVSSMDSNIICSSAVIGHGSSGGGLFDASGRLIGMTSAFAKEKYFSIPITKVLNVPRSQSIPLREMKNYVYTPSSPKDLRSAKGEKGYTYVSWAPVYKADYYKVYISHTQNGGYKLLKNKTLGGTQWHWGFPHSFGIVSKDGSPTWLKVSAVVNGRETAPCQPIRIN